MADADKKNGTPVPQGPTPGVHLIVIELDAIAGRLDIKTMPKDKILTLGMLELAKGVIQRPEPSGNLLTIPRANGR